MAPILPGHGKISVGDKEDAPSEEGKNIKQEGAPEEEGKTPDEEKADIETDVKAEVQDSPGARAREAPKPMWLKTQNS